MPWIVLKLADNTIVLFASDNGSQFEVTSTDMDLSKASNSPKDVKKRGQDSDAHYPNYPFRGTKWSAWEGGVRTPLIARWPNRFPAGAKSKQLFGLNDIMATLASIIGFELPVDAAVDSYNQLSVLMGNDTIIRKSVVIESSNGRLGLRKGKWKYIKSKDSTMIGELYDLQSDVSESKNRSEEHPELVQRMEGELRAITQGKRSNKND